MARAKILVEAERKDLMRKGGLWLTCGGRVVKPGWGEYASEQSNDIELMRVDEIERGIGMEVFNARLKKAMWTWKRRQKEGGVR